MPKTILFSFRGYDESLNELFTEHSPLCQAAYFPKIPYLIFHADGDSLVNKQAHSDRMVAAMRKNGLQVQYMELNVNGHCQLTKEAQSTLYRFIDAAMKLEK